MTRVRTHHDPECKIPSHPDLGCDEAELVRVEEARHATWGCSRSPSRTQPEHEFDLENDGECIHGCGTSWDQMRGAE